MKKLSLYLCSALLCVSVLPALADSSAASDRPGKGKHHTPPPEAIAACKGLTEKTTCQFTNHKSEIVAGVCDTPRVAADKADAELVCRPQRGEHRKHDHEKDDTTK